MATKKTVKKTTAKKAAPKKVAPKKTAKKTVAKRDPKKPLTKSQLANEMATTLELPRKQVMAIFDELGALAYAETKKTGSFLIPGIGKLVLQARKARMGRNPQTGESIKIPAKKVVKFRVAKAAKDEILPAKK